MTPNAKKRKRKPTIAETREEMARSGDLDGLWSVLTSTHPSLLDLEATFRLLARALEVRARQDPAAFAGDVFSRVVGFVTYLLLRSQLYADMLIRIHDRSGRFGDMPRELTELVLPRMLELQRHLCETLSAQAATARQWALTRQKTLENGRVAGQPVPSGNLTAREECPDEDRLHHERIEPATPTEARENTEEPDRDGTEVDSGPMRPEILTGSPVAERKAEDRDRGAVFANARDDHAEVERQTQGVGSALPLTCGRAAEAEVRLPLS